MRSLAYFSIKRQIDNESGAITRRKASFPVFCLFFSRKHQKVPPVHHELKYLINGDFVLLTESHDFGPVISENIRKFLRVR